MAKQPKFVRAGDAAAELLAQLKAPRQVYIDGSDVVLNVEYEYRIALDRCDTPATLLGWVLHLSSKTWMTPQLLASFVYHVSQANSIEIDRNM